MITDNYIFDVEFIGDKKEFYKTFGAPSMVVQSLIFSKEVFKSVSEVRKWVQEHDYKILE